jgi:hypothetical protein
MSMPRPGISLLRAFLRCPQGKILPVPFTAAVTVTGDPGLLQAYRVRVRELLDAEQVDDYRELHTVERLDWRFKLKDGVPFPAFVDSSLEFPDLLVHVKWSRPADGQTGLATIQNGNVTQQSAGPADSSDRDNACYDLQVAPNGQLTLALAARTWGDGALVGYALTDDQHAWFRISAAGGASVLVASDGMEPEWAERWTVADGHAQYEELGEREPVDATLLRELEKLARELCAEWIWFAASPLEDTIVERQRYEQYGFAMREANVRSLKLRTVMQAGVDGGFQFAGARADVAAARELLLRCWVRGI